MGLAYEKTSYLQEKANLFEIGSYNRTLQMSRGNIKKNNFSGIIFIKKTIFLICRCSV